MAEDTVYYIDEVVEFGSGRNLYSVSEFPRDVAEALQKLGRELKRLERGYIPHYTLRGLSAEAKTKYKKIDEELQDTRRTYANAASRYRERRVSFGQFRAQPGAFSKYDIIEHSRAASLGIKKMSVRI